MSEDPQTSSPPADADRVRVTCLAGTVAAIAVVVAFFLPWVEVPPEAAARFRQRVEERIRDDVQPLPPGVDARDWLRLARLLEENASVTGIDVFFWARTGTRTAEAFEAPSPGGDGPSGDVPRTTAVSPRRALLVTAIALGALPLTGVLLGVTFLLLRCRRAPSAFLVLALLTATVALTVPAVYSVIRPALYLDTRPALGQSLLLVGGGLLFLVGVFGVRARNWWRVFAGFVLAAGLLGLLAWSYVSGGGAP